MNVNFFSLLLLFLLVSCKKESVQTPAEAVRISKNVQIEENSAELKLTSNQFSYTFSKTDLPFKKTVVLNASLIGYFTALNAEDRIAGVSSPEYIYSEKVKNLIGQQIIQNVGNEQKYNVEKILALKPDAVFTNYISAFENTYDVLNRNGIRVIFLNEFMEQNPLEKSAYLILFGKLLGKETLAEEEFIKISQNYKQIRETALNSKQIPKVISNEMYGNQWFMPGGKTQLAHFIKDANADYILKENPDEKAVPLSFEEVLAKSKEADFWVNAGNHSSRKSLLTVNPNYQKLNVFQNGKIYALTAKESGKSNDFFESGVVRADLVLKDYVKIFHPELMPDYELSYLEELK